MSTEKEHRILFRGEGGEASPGEKKPVVGSGGKGEAAEKPTSPEQEKVKELTEEALEKMEKELEEETEKRGEPLPGEKEPVVRHGEKGEAAEKPTPPAHEKVKELTEEALKKMERELEEEMKNDPKLQATIKKLEERMKKPFTAEEIQKNLKGTETLLAQLKELEGNLSKALEKHREFQARFLEKYGTTTEPKLTINPTYTQPTVTPDRFRFASPEKDMEYEQLALSLNASVMLLEHHLLRLAALTGKSVATEEYLPGISKIERSTPYLQDTYIEGKGMTLRPGECGHALLLAYMVGTVEEKLLNLDVTTFDLLEINRLREQIKAKRPDLLENAADPEEMRRLLAPILGRVFEGYPDVFPQVVIHPTKEKYKEWRKDKDTTIDSAGCHSPGEDVIATYAKPKIDLIRVLLHEYGHVPCRTSEDHFFAGLKKSEGNVEQITRAQEEVKRLRETLQLLEKEENPGKRQELSTLARSLIFSVNSTMQLLSLIALESNLRLFDPKYEHTQIDEVSAYVMEQLLTRELFGNDPELLSLVRRYADVMNRGTDDVEHYGAVVFADELVAQNKGDLAETLRHLATLTDPATMQRYGKRIQEINASRGVVGGTQQLLGSTDRFMRTSNAQMEIWRKIKSISDEYTAVRKQMDAAPDEETREKVKTAFLERMKVAVGELDERVAGDFLRLLEKMNGDTHEQKPAFPPRPAGEVKENSAPKSLPDSPEKKMEK